MADQARVTRNKNKREKKNKLREKQSKNWNHDQDQTNNYSTRDIRTQTRTLCNTKHPLI